MVVGGASSEVALGSSHLAPISTVKAPEITNIPWKRLAVDVFHLEATPAFVSTMRRAYRDWRLHSVEGSFSAVGAGASTRTARRRAVKTWFIDFCVGWRVRSRRARITMRHTSGRSDRGTGGE